MKSELLDDRYRIKRKLGAGGQGRVYLAEDTADENAQVAVKKYTERERPDRADHRKRMANEIQALRDLKSDRVVRLIAANLGSEGDGCESYIVTEYARFGTLEDHNYFNGEIELSLRLFRQICEGVQAIHDKDILHRDLKPSNVLLIDSEKDPRVGDFGVCLLGTDEDADRATKVRERVGPMFFAAPEQTSLPPTFSKRGDIYSLGRILYFMITGDRAGAPGAEYIPPSVHLGLQERHPIDSFIRRMTEFDPKGRPGTVSEVLDEVGKLLGTSRTEMKRRSLTKMQKRIVKYIGSDSSSEAELEGILDYLACFSNVCRNQMMIGIPALTGRVSWERFADIVETSLDQLEVEGILRHDRGSYSLLEGSGDIG